MAVVRVAGRGDTENEVRREAWGKEGQVLQKAESSRSMSKSAWQKDSTLKVTHQLAFVMDGSPCQKCLAKTVFKGS